MSLLRTIFLSASQSAWLRDRAPRLAFVRRTAGRFLPGEDAEAALAAARTLAESGVITLLTHLGENVASRDEAAAVTSQYLDLIARVRAAGLPSEISVKLTQLGLDLDAEFCFANLVKLIEASASADPAASKTLWIDIEQSPYVDVTLELYHRARAAYRNVGVCVQAYLYRTEKDVASLIAQGATVRLVKGAYNEPAEIAYPKKSDVDESYFRLAQMLLGPEARAAGVRAAMATHDRAIDRAHHRMVRRAANSKSRARIRHALRYPARRTASPRPRGLSQLRPHLLRLVLVPLVHAPPRRTSRQRLVPRPQFLFIEIRNWKIENGRPSTHVARARFFALFYFLFSDFCFYRVWRYATRSSSCS